MMMYWYSQTLSGEKNGSGSASVGWTPSTGPRLITLCSAGPMVNQAIMQTATQSRAAGK